MDLDELGRAVFRVVCKDGSGTAFAIDAGELVVTAAHVLNGVDHCLVLQGEPPGKHWGASGKVVLVDELADVAIVRTEKRTPHGLTLNPDRVPTRTDHLLVWDWPAWQGNSKPLLERAAKARPLAAIYTASWRTQQGSPRFGFAGHVEPGMSGGPVVSAESGEALGLVLGTWHVDEGEIVDNWWANVGNRYEVRTDSEVQPSHLIQSVKAHLALGMGIALPADRIAVAAGAIH